MVLLYYIYKINKMIEQPTATPSQEEFSRFPYPEDIPSEYDRTVDGYVQILGDMQVTQIALATDYKLWSYDHRAEVEAAAKPDIDAMNQQRPPDTEALDPAQAHVNFLSALTRPNWADYFPKGDTEEDHKNWEDFKGKFTPGMQVNLEALRSMHTKVEILQGDEQLQAEFQETRSEHIQDLRHAAMWRSASRKIETTGQQIAELRITAGRSGRPLTPAEKQQIQTLTLQQESYRDSQRNVPITEEVKTELHRAASLDSKKELEDGLLMTEQMRDIIDQVLPALSRGEPALLVGETGGAKTALAEFISRKYFGVEAEFISGNAEFNNYQLMGKATLDEKNTATVSSYSPGPAVRAMEEGKPLIVDEINAIPPGLLKRMNKLAQLRPGDRFVVQEDSGREVVVQPGFCVIATANEKSKRYKQVEDLSVEFMNRFGANIYRVRYPDHDVQFGAVPTENVLLAHAAVIDKKGELPEDMNPDVLYNFVKACHVSQQVFSGNQGEGYDIYTPGDRRVDNKPGLDETVLAPRTMVGILKDVAGSYGQVSLEKSLARFVDGIKNANDKQVTLTILQGHGFLKPPEKPAEK